MRVDGSTEFSPCTRRDGFRWDLRVGSVDLQGSQRRGMQANEHPGRPAASGVPCWSEATQTEIRQLKLEQPDRLETGGHRAVVGRDRHRTSAKIDEAPRR